MNILVITGSPKGKVLMIANNSRILERNHQFEGYIPSHIGNADVFESAQDNYKALYIGIIGYDEGIVIGS